MIDLSNIHNIFFTVAIVSTILYALKITIFALGGSGDSDLDFSGEADTSFSFISIQSILAFFMGFGWAGIAAENKFSAPITLLVAFATGILFWLFSAYLMFNIKKLGQTVKTNVKELEGKYGKSYTSFKPHGTGQIEAELNGKLTILDALNSTDEEIKSFERIKIIKADKTNIEIIKE